MALKPVPTPEPTFGFGVKVELSRDVESQISALMEQMANLTMVIGEFMQRPPYTVVMPQAQGRMLHTFTRDENGRVTGAIVEPYDQ